MPVSQQMSLTLMSIRVIIPASMPQCALPMALDQEVGFKLGEQHQNITYYQDYTIMRYADVLLMHSELNGTADGLNKVRARVGLEPEDYSIENIRKERAIELAFEGVHFWDLMRYGKDGSYAAQEIAKAQNGAKVKNGGVESSYQVCC